MAAPPKENPLTGDVMKTLETYKSGQIPLNELRKAYVTASEKQGLPQDKALVIFEKVLAAADPENTGKPSRLAILKALESQGSSINSLIDANILHPSENQLLSSVMQKLEESPSGEVTKSQLLDALSTVAAKPVDKKQLKALAEKIMGKSTKLTRGQIRNGIKSSPEALSNLAEKVSTQHKAVSEILKDLEACKSGMIRKDDIKAAIMNNPSLKDLPKAQLEALMNSVFAIADPENKGKMHRNALRSALKSKIPEIDTL